MTDSGLCGWDLATCGCGKCWGNYPPEVKQQAETLATSLIWKATGRQFGVCDITVMPCNAPTLPPLYQVFPVTFTGFGETGGAITYPVLDSGTWRNVGCGGTCGCAARCEVALPGPVASIVEVRVDGEVVDPVAYQVYDRSTLVRIDGACWPTCQIMGLEVPEFEVTYGRGQPVPTDALSAAATLACQYAKLLATGSCALPQRVTQITRQGVQIALAAIPDKPTMIRTGIQAVDDVIAGYNPYGLMQPLTVLSPDQPHARQITWAPTS